MRALSAPVLPLTDVRFSGPFGSGHGRARLHRDVTHPAHVRDAILDVAAPVRSRAPPRGRRAPGSAACRGQAPNETLEAHAFESLLGSVAGLDVLDLGCGDGTYGRELLQRGCRSYLGLDASRRMITCCADARADGGPRTSWLVDDYFVSGARVAPWFGVTVEKYHRTIEEYFALLHSAGLQIEDLKEATPRPEHIVDPVELRHRQRLPLMLLLRARRRER